MREIKFRAWDKRIDKWFQPTYKASEGNIEDMSISLRGLVLIKNTEYTDSTMGDWFILEQFTGLKDKNGKEIYEGDYIQQGKDIMRVVWSGAHASFALGRVNWAFLHFFYEAVDAHRCEVIGNVHENPELIK